MLLLLDGLVLPFLLEYQPTYFKGASLFLQFTYKHQTFAKSVICASHSVKCIPLLLANRRLLCLAFLGVKKEHVVTVTMNDACH